MAHRVLIISASMGAGHDGAARELARRLREAGHEVEIRDFLEAPPWPVGVSLQKGYAFQIRHLAWSYELTYRFWSLLPFLCGPLASFVAMLTRRSMRRWVQEANADVVVSTYPLTSQGLGVMRKRGQLKVPAATFLTDFAIHPVWVHPGIDLHLAVHPEPAAEAARQSGGPVLAPGPLVSPRFRQPVDREAVRAGLGLAPEDRAVLVVAGSWGVGAIAETFHLTAGSGRFVPVVVCGRDERLRRRLVAAGGDERRVIGWTDQMPALMAAADALVENAGGLTSMEAITAGLPVVSFLPIAGHGRENTKRMEQAGVARRADTPAELLAALDVLTRPGPERDAQVAAGLAMLAGDAAECVVELADAAAAPAPASATAPSGAVPAAAAPAVAAPTAGTTAATPGGASPPAAVTPLRPAARRRSASLVRAAAVAAAVVLASIGLDTGLGVAAAHGVGVAHAAKPAVDVSYLAVRVNATEATDAGVLSALQRLHATAVVDRAMARSQPDALRRMGALNIDVQNGGSGRHIELPWSRAQADVVQSRRLMEQLTGHPVRVFVPARRLDGIDLIWCRGSHARAVVAHRLAATVPAAGQLSARRTYVVDGTDVGQGQLVATLDGIGQQLAAMHLAGAPLSDLR